MYIHLHGLGFLFSRLVRQHIGLFNSRSVLAIGLQYFSLGCLVGIIGLGLNHLLCFSSNSAFLANFKHKLVLLSSNEFRAEMCKAFSQYKQSSPSIMCNALFWTLSISLFSAKVMPPFQAGAANSRILLTCFMYISTSFGF